LVTEAFDYVALRMSFAKDCVSDEREIIRIRAVAFLEDSIRD
jgi:hypothetical protein